MKKMFNLVVLFMCLFILAACPEMGYKNLVQIKNNSEHNITTYVSVVPRINGASLYPDTVLPSAKVGIEISKNQEETYSYNYQYFENKNDTLCFFIWDTDTANVVSWDLIQSKYHILQRYDISKMDLESLHWKLTYPPTEAMKYIKMYPPYSKP